MGSSTRALRWAATTAAALMASPADAFVGCPGAVAAAHCPAAAAASAVGSSSFPGAAAAAALPRRRAAQRQHGAAPLPAVSLTYDEEGDEASSDAVTAALHPLTDNVVFSALQAVYAVAIAGLADAAFSGDWVARGVLSVGIADAAAAAFYNVAGAHVLLAAAAAALAHFKGRPAAPAAAMTLATGGLGLMRVAGALDAEVVMAQQAANAPALSMEISSLSHAQNVSPSGVLLSTSIIVRKGREPAMRLLLEKLVSDVRGSSDGDAAAECYTITVNQDPEDRRNFFMMQRFPSPAAMQRHQQSAAFKAFTGGAGALVAQPMGLYIVNERSGKLQEAVYPFGPGGEGGRDDAIYSSPTNIQGSLTGF